MAKPKKKKKETGREALKLERGIEELKAWHRRRKLKNRRK